MKKIIAVAVLCSCLASVAPAAPTGQSLLVKPYLLAYFPVYGSFDPVDAFLGWCFAKGMNWVVANWNNGNAAGTGAMPAGMMPQAPTGGGGGGAW